MEDDPAIITVPLPCAYFNPRPPCGGRLASVFAIGFTPPNFNPRPPCGGRLLWSVPARRETRCYFNPRPPCGGRRRGVNWRGRRREFQSTSPVWRTTPLHCQAPPKSADFNPRPPCGGRHPSDRAAEFLSQISIHVPRVEDDLLHHIPNGGKRDFNPRPPCGGRLDEYTTRLYIGYFNPRPPCGGRRR